MPCIQASYFVISEPQLNTQWVNGGTNLVSWEKGLLDGINGFDVELARLSQDGLTLVARNGESRHLFVTSLPTSPPLLFPYRVA